MPLIRILGISAIIFLLDRGLKFWVVEGMDLRNIYAIDVWPPYLNLRMGWNEGMNFGLFASGSDITKWVLIGIGLAFSAALLFWFRNTRKFWLQLSVGLVVGGAIGNIYDRLAYGAVADFLNMSCCGINNPFVFNAADISIFAGIAGVIIFDNKKPEKSHKR